MTQTAESAELTQELTPQGRVDLKKAIELRYKNQLTMPEIAEIFGVTKQAVHQQLSKVDKLIKGDMHLEAFRQNRINILEGAEFELISDLLDQERRQKASLNNVAYAFNQVHNARRLESGQSTANIGVSVESRLNKALEQAGNTEDNSSLDDQY
jgi:predicted DNA-binding protein YlxM (UPF0122 family)